MQYFTAMYLFFVVRWQKKNRKGGDVTVFKRTYWYCSLSYGKINGIFGIMREKTELERHVLVKENSLKI